MRLRLRCRCFISLTPTLGYTRILLHIVLEVLQLSIVRVAGSLLLPHLQKVVPFQSKAYFVVVIGHMTLLMPIRK